MKEIHEQQGYVTKLHLQEYHEKCFYVIRKLIFNENNRDKSWRGYKEENIGNFLCIPFYSV